MAEVLTTVYKTTDAKAFFASERTFLHWLSLSVTFGSIAAGMVGLSAHSAAKWGSSHSATAIVIRLVGLLVLAFAIALAIAACWNFYTRGHRLRMMSDGPYDSQLLPGVVGVLMLLVLAGTWIGAIISCAA